MVALTRRFLSAGAWEKLELPVAKNFSPDYMAWFLDQSDLQPGFCPEYPAKAAIARSLLALPVPSPGCTSRIATAPTTLTDTGIWTWNSWQTRSATNRHKRAGAPASGLMATPLRKACIVQAATCSQFSAPVCCLAILLPFGQKCKRCACPGARPETVPPDARLPVCPANEFQQPRRLWQ